MTRDGEIAAIFNPKRVRAPSVVVTGDSPNGTTLGGFTNIVAAVSAPPPLIHSDSLVSSQADTENTIICTQICNNTSITTPTTDLGSTTIPTVAIRNPSKPNKCRDSCCSEWAQKMYFGVCVTILVTASWVGATHCIRFLYIRRIPIDNHKLITDQWNGSYSSTIEPIIERSIRTKLFPLLHQLFSGQFEPSTETIIQFNAPFFAAWFFTNFTILFFPIYLIGRVAVKKCESPCEILGDVLRGFRDRGFTVGRFIRRCLTFCLLWVLTTYLYALSLRALLSTDVMALFATNVACAYLLSWVILHEQFVGVRIVAVILCDTGIALLAYMDGITGSPTLGGVVLAVLAAAGYAVFKVMFKKVMRDPPIGQVAFTFSTLGFLNASMLWPVCLTLYFSGTEAMPWERWSWIVLLLASVLLLVFHILTQFSTAVTYTMFVTLGLITAVPVSAALDVVLYGANFVGMKLAGVILIAIGFFLVMFPNNWPDYITRLLRKFGRAIVRYQCCCDIGEFDKEKSKYHLVGTQRQMGSWSPNRFNWYPPTTNHRLSNRLHTVTSTFAIRSGEMTDTRPQRPNNLFVRPVDGTNVRSKRHFMLRNLSFNELKCGDGDETVTEMDNLNGGERINGRHFNRCKRNRKYQRTLSYVSTD